MPRVMRRATAMDVGPSVPLDWHPAAARPAVSDHVN
jgi:hypothetical protein